MIDGRDIVCFSSIDWDYLWQVHQELMSRFAAGGTRVLYVESTGLRAPSLGDVPRLWRRLRNVTAVARGQAAPRPAGVTVHAPAVLPLPYSPAARAINRRLLAPALDRWLDGRPAPIAWIFLPTPLTLELSAHLRPALTVYYCVDDLPLSSHGAAAVRGSEDALFRSADLVFVTSHQLQNRALQWRPEAHVMPAGVDYERFAARPQAVPDDLRAIRQPIAGYAGGQPPWLDTRLLAATAARMPDVQFVLVGPASIPELAGISNVHALGPRPHADLPSYLHGFDVGLVPYAETDYTNAIYPAKLNEYLAAGLPVVSTPIEEMRRLNDAHGPVVETAHGADAFASAIRRALADRAAGRAARQAIARSHDWGLKAAAMAARVNAALAGTSARATAT